MKKAAGILVTCCLALLQGASSDVNGNGTEALVYVVRMCGGLWAAADMYSWKGRAASGKHKDGWLRGFLKSRSAVAPESGSNYPPFRYFSTLFSALFNSSIVPRGFFSKSLQV